MSPSAVPEKGHQRAWALLPWLVNGRLSRDDEQWVGRHLEECADCRAEVRLQREIRASLSSDARLEYAPQASFQKLLARIEELDREEPRAAPKARAPRAAMSAVSTRIPRWLVATLVAQSLAVIALALTAGWQALQQGLAPRYETLTIEQPAAVIGGNLRLVLAPTATVADLEDLLRSIEGRIVAGPSGARVWTVFVPHTAASSAFAEALRRLRADHRVLLAEPAAIAGPPL